jgi:hypothetical protein
MFPLGYPGIEQDQLAARLDVAYFAHSDLVWMVGELRRQTFTNRFVWLPFFAWAAHNQQFGHIFLII